MEANQSGNLICISEVPGAFAIGEVAPGYLAGGAGVSGAFECEKAVDAKVELLSIDRTVTIAVPGETGPITVRPVLLLEVVGGATEGGSGFGSFGSSYTYTLGVAGSEWTYSGLWSAGGFAGDTPPGLVTLDPVTVTLDEPFTITKQSIVSAWGAQTGGPLVGWAFVDLRNTAQWQGFADLPPNAIVSGVIDWSQPAPIPPACPGDLNGDGEVTSLDLNILLGQTWGPCSEPCPVLCQGDLDGDCVVGSTDLNIVLGNWGACHP